MADGDPFADFSEVINRSSGGNNGNPQNIFCYFDPRVGSSAAATPVAGRWIDLFLYNKCFGGQGVGPGAAAVPTSATAGAIPFTNPGGSRKLRILGALCASGLSGSLMLFDRLVHMSGLDGNSTSAQTTNLPTSSLTRNTGGIGNMIMLTIHGQIGTNGRQAWVKYTDTDNNAAQSSKTITIGGTGLRDAERALLIPLIDSDIGVKVIEEFKIDSAGTGTTGNIGLSIIKPIGIISCPTTGVTLVEDWTTGLPIIPEIPANACLCGLFLCNGTTPLVGMIQLFMAER